MWIRFDIRLPEPAPELDAFAWHLVAEAAQKNEWVPIGREWLLDARSFHDAHNYNMALSAAAVACEVYGHELLRRHLVSGQRVSDERARKFLEEVSNRDLFPTLFRYFEIGDENTADTLTEVFRERNAIMHGKRKRQVSEAKSDAALNMAEFLEND